MREMTYDCVALDNEWVTVTRDAAPRQQADPSSWGERVVVAMGDIEVTADGQNHALSRGQFIVVSAGESYALVAGSAYFEVAIKVGHPPIRTPEIMIVPAGNAVRYRGPKFFVYEEILEVGATRVKHSHCQRVEIRLSNGPMLHQWIWQGGAMREMEPARVNWREPMVHEVHNIGDAALHNLIVEFLPPEPGAQVSA